MSEPAIAAAASDAGSILTADEETPLLNSSKLAPTDKGRPAYLALSACCLLQLPVWGFVVSYGVLQEFYTHEESSPSTGDSVGTPDFKGDISQTGIIGTTLNGIMYLSMPLLFGLFSHRLARWRRPAAALGILLSALSLILSSYANAVWELIVTQGVLQAMGSTLLYSSTTIYLDEWFIKRKGFAYGVISAIKSLFGVVTPLVFNQLFTHLGFRWTLRVWAIITAVFSFPAIWMLQSRFDLSLKAELHGKKRPLTWAFLRHRTFWVFQIANVIFSLAYGLPQTYLAQFGSGIVNLSPSYSALIVVALNATSVPASFWFGLLSDGGGLMRGKSVSIETISLLSAMGAALPAFLLWGLVPVGANTADTVMLTLFAFFYGFFAGGYSATWGGVVKEANKEAESKNEPVDTGLLFGLLNGGRGIGFVAGGLIGVQLLKEGPVPGASPEWGYGTQYGDLILFVAICSALGGFAVLFRNTRVLGM